MMRIPSEFDAIRPFEAEELPAVYERLIADPQFASVIEFIFPDIPFETFAEKMRGCRRCLDFQLMFCYMFLERLLAKASTGCDMNIDAIDNKRRYTFVSNHRDIVLDPGLLSKLLIDNKFTTTCEIAIGDNLLSLPWVKDLARLNKTFIVERGLPMRQMLEASKRLSAYMHYAIEVKHENIWIAQREGRAKDSDDRTQQAVLKMMAMAGEGNLVERLKSLHIVPLSISYEYDPCDFLKAAEFQLKRDVKGWKKGANDDVLSMQTGIMGYKGNIHYHCAPCIDRMLEGLDPEMPKTDFYRLVAEHIDGEIHKNYRLYPNNFIAWDMLEGSDLHRNQYTEEDKNRFEMYIQKQLAKISIPDKDEKFLTERMLTMYANPAINHFAAL